MKCSLLLLLAFFSFTGLSAQISNDDILKDFDNFLKIPESNIYMHLNKSVLMQGEDLGFTAYVFDHKKQKPSQDVKNLYSQLINDEGVVVKEQLMQVQNGKTSGKFILDELTPAGNYTVRGFTNWMKNFKSPHYFETSIKVIDVSGVVEKSKSNKLDAAVAHILPEGGHLVNNVLSTVGLKIEHSQNLEGKYASISVNGVVKSRVLLDRNGMGRFIILPNLNSEYEVRLEGSDNLLIAQFPIVEEQGVVMAFNQNENNVFIELKTNDETLNNFDTSKLSLLINSNGDLNIYNINLNQLNELITFDNKDFVSGVNQISLLSKDQKVISKRLFFNYEDFSIGSASDVVAAKVLDTIKTSLQFKSFNTAQISVSVHTPNSIALDKSQSITTAFKLYPYLYAKVKDPLYYLKNVDKKKMYDMDNLMLCMGWEMYNWDFIFQENKVFDNRFESGILVKAAIKNSKTDRYMIYPGRNTGTSFIDVSGDNDSFSFESYFPSNQEKLIISEINKANKSRSARLSLEFFPNEIPNFVSTTVLEPFEISDDFHNIELKPFLDSSQELDTIQINAVTNQDRNTKISARSRGYVEFFTDEHRKSNFDILQYLRQNGLDAKTRDGEVTLFNPSSRVRRNVPVLLIVDDVIQRDANILQGFVMADIDYVEFDFTNLIRYAGEGQGGIVKIKTDPLLNPYSKSSKKVSKFDVPLTFSAPSKFYRPSYYSYNDEFFDKLGVIDWQGEINVVDGKASFTMPYLGKDKLLLHIQGWTEDGKLIDEIREVDLSNTNSVD